MSDQQESSDILSQTEKTEPIDTNKKVYGSKSNRDFRTADALGDTPIQSGSVKGETGSSKSNREPRPAELP